MSNQIEIVNSESAEVYLSLAEAANLKGITNSALRRYFKKYNFDKSGYLMKRIHSCSITKKTRSMTVISKNVFIGISKYAGFPSSNQYQRKSDGASLFEKSQNQGIVQAPQQTQITIPDVKQLALELVDDLTKAKITTEQKCILSDMVKAATFKKLRIKLGEKYDPYIFQQNVVSLRTYLNAYIGRRTVDNYTHLDYIKAWKYLKKLCA